ncbi:MAG: leucyl aminopeptidase [Myxococcota bacterium]
MNIRFATDPLDKVAADVLVVAVGPTLDGPITALDARFEGGLLAELRARKFKGAEGSLVSFATLGRIPARHLFVVGTGGGTGFDAMRVVAARAGKEARTLGAGTVALSLPGVAPEIAVQLVESAASGNYLYQRYRPEEDRSNPVSEWIALGTAQTLAAVPEATLKAADVRVKWQGWSRDLVNAPAADLYPESLAARARELGALPGVTVEVWDFERCRAEGCVGIIAVGQGSQRPGCLIRVSYRPEGAKDHVAFVGKGVTFDSGGLSLKPSDGMMTMRCDMGGAATVLGATGIVAELGVPVAVDTFVPAVENMTGGLAYKLGDVLRYSNGVTVEIANTDAEGRLVLADALIRACKVQGVSTIVDAATLTGACVVALGDDYTGLFTNDDPLATELLGAATATGEGLWRLPLHAPYNEQLKSEFAQIKNVGSRYGGAITAGLFLKHFVADGMRWAHLDIAGPAFHDKGSVRYPAGATGEMVRSLASFVERRAG